MISRSTPVLALLAFLGMGIPSFAHGGAYRAPGGAGPLSPGPGMASGSPGAFGPGGAPAPIAPTSAPSGFGQSGDLNHWGLWWRQNRAQFLALKEHIHAVGPLSGLEGWYLGEGQAPQARSLRPTADQARDLIAPALLAVLEEDGSNDLVSGALIALAKIGAEADPTDGARFENAILAFLTDSNQEIRETAAVALGILASPRSIPTLAHLLWDTDQGQKTVRSLEVDYRTRSFAAYGLGLIGARTESEPDRQLIVSVLRRALEADRTSSQDLSVACVVAMGVVPLATIDTPALLAGERRISPETSRLAQLEYVRALLRDEKAHTLARAQCPTTLARLLNGDAWAAAVPEPHRAAYRAEIAGELVERIERDRDRNDVLESCVLALGQIGTSDQNDLDAKIRRVLVNVPRSLSQPQARAYAMMAAAEAGARFGPDRSGEGIEVTSSALLYQMGEGKHQLQPWAALGAGVLARRLHDKVPTHSVHTTLRRVLRRALEQERSPERMGAYALAAGLARSHDSAPYLMKQLDKGRPDDVRGQIALGLALLEHVDAIEPLRAIVADSQYHPELLLQGSIALALLGDKDIAVQLANMLGKARSLASQAAIASALGFIGDQRSVDPLLKLLVDRLATSRARAFAAVALGNVADKEPFPWNAKLGEGLNYRAAPPTLSDPTGGSGILDLF